MVDLSRMPGITSLRNLCKAYKSIIRKWVRRKKPPSPSETPVTVEEAKENLERQSRVQQDPEGITMNELHSFKSYNSDPLGGNRKMSFRCLFRHRSVNCLPSMGSLSRRASKRSRTPTTTSSPTSKSKSRERKSYDSISTPSSKSSSDNLRTPSPLSSNFSRRASTPIMYSSSSGILKPPPIEKNLECTLEELCYGCKKEIKITREDVLTDTGEIVVEEELLTINVKPGWKKGTKITFERKGNERHGAYQEDIVVFISEKRHQSFRRSEGDDLELALEIPLLKALTGCTISVPLLGGERMNLTIDDIVQPGYEKIITGQGMPISREPEKRGNLRITFLVEFPTQLTDVQRSEVVSILQDSS